MQTLTATYSLEDNKLRLYTTERLDTDTYERVKNAGFIWAPKQGLFVAPMWTPERESLLLELCREIGDEETTLRDRAKAKAERLEVASSKAHAEADTAHATAQKISEKFWGGQPILVGHHSEGRMRRDQARMHRNMRKAIDDSEKAQALADKAEASLDHAERKNRIKTRLNRIERLEADLRRTQRNLTSAQGEERQRMARWEQHYSLRLEYEKKELKAQGYEAPTPPARAKVAPLVNYPGEGFIHMTKAEYEAYGDKGWNAKIAESESLGAYRCRSIYGVWLDDKLPPLPDEASYRDKSHARHRVYRIFITDLKVIEPPKPYSQGNES